MVFSLEGASQGTWVAHAFSYNSDTVKGENATLFGVGVEPDSSVLLPVAKGEQLSISADQHSYAVSDTVRLLVSSPAAKRVEVSLDSGTRFYVDLPFTIPIINVQRLYTPYWWFIFVTIVTGLLISLGGSLYERIAKGF